MVFEAILIYIFIKMVFKSNFELIELANYLIISIEG